MFYKLKYLDEVRRFSCDETPSLSTLTNQAKTFPNAPALFKLKWSDDGGDLCTLYDESSVRDAFGARSTPLTVFIIEGKCSNSKSAASSFV